MIHQAYVARDVPRVSLLKILELKGVATTNDEWETS